MVMPGTLAVLRRFVLGAFRLPFLFLMWRAVQTGREAAEALSKLCQGMASLVHLLEQVRALVMLHTERSHALSEHLDALRVQKAAPQVPPGVLNPPTGLADKGKGSAAGSSTQAPVIHMPARLVIKGIQSAVRIWKSEMDQHYAARAFMDLLNSFRVFFKSQPGKEPSELACQFLFLWHQALGLRDQSP